MLACALLATACVVEETYGTCGNGVIEQIYNPSENGDKLFEACDDGNTVNGDGCSSTCEVQGPVCGDGIKLGAEQCDDGNTISHDGCSATCMVDAPICGDGVKAGTEVCDDGNATRNDGCTADCKLETAVCGDNVKAGTEACDDGNRTPRDGCSATCEVDHSLGITWRVKTNNNPVACPVGFDTARIVAHPHALPSSNTSNDIIDLFNCSASTGVAAPYPSNQYDVYVEIVNNNGTLTYATSVPTFIDLTTADKDATFDIHTDKGFFFLNWALQGASGALTCAQAPEVASIGLDTTPVTPPTEFPCTSGAGYSAAAPVATYVVSVAALNAAKQGHGTPVNLPNQAIQAPNKITNLGTAMLVIPGH